jgi:translation initiation factor IF-1
MVKNTNGGSKAKGFARKHANNTNNNNNDVRVVEEEGEIYAVVTKMCGGGMFQCYGIDHVERLCHIRGSFSGRKKRDNIVVNGGWVLIGLREWDRKDEEKLPAGSSFTTTTKKAKLPQCDLLEVYNDKDREKLLATVKENWKVLIKHDPTRIGFDDDDEVLAFGKDDDEEEEFGFKFATDAEIERDELLKLVKSSATEKVKMAEDVNAEAGQVEEMVSFDDL